MITLIIRFIIITMSLFFNCKHINRFIVAMEKKQQLSTQNLVDHVNREAEIFDAIDHSNDEPINST